jgi:hypothetical protein
VSEPKQLDMFDAAEPTKPVEQPDNLLCGCNLSQVGAGVGPHLASLHCTQCGCWLPQGAVNFLTDTIERFGRPNEPICVRASCGRDVECAPGAGQVEARDLTGGMKAMARQRSHSTRSSGMSLKSSLPGCDRQPSAGQLVAHRGSPK